MSATIILLLLMIAMIIHVLMYTGFNKIQKAWFAATFSAISFCAVAEYLVHCGYHNPAFNIPLTILTVLQFSIAPCFSMLFAGALGLKHQGKIILVSFVVCLLIESICAIFSIIFKFDTDGVYHRQHEFYIYGITYVASLLYLAVALIIVGTRFRHRDKGTIVMIMVVLASGIVPMSRFEVHIAYLAVGISACLCYVYYNDLIQHDTKEELVRNQQKVSDMQAQIIARLANLIESRDTETGEHVLRTSAYVKMLAEDLRKEGVYGDIIDDKYIDMLFTLAPMHDVGKILVSDRILRKPGKLTPEEYEEIKKHAAFGGDVVRQVLSGMSDEEQINFAIEIATCHHERWDGSGYPKGIKGEEIPLCARIMSLADVFDALVSKRCYKDPIPVEEAFEIIKNKAGTHFDPKIVKVFLAHKEQYEAVNKEIADPE